MVKSKVRNKKVPTFSFWIVLAFLLLLLLVIANFVPDNLVLFSEPGASASGASGSASGAECEKDADCGTDYPLGPKFCSSGKILQRYYHYTCYYGRCSESEEEKIIQDCDDNNPCTYDYCDSDTKKCVSKAACPNWWQACTIINGKINCDECRNPSFIINKGGSGLLSPPFEIRRDPGLSCHDNKKCCERDIVDENNPPSKQNRCEQCCGDSDCTIGVNKKCCAPKVFYKGDWENKEGTCQECCEDGDCGSRGIGYTCKSGKCVSCILNSDCKDSVRQVCDLMNGECVECLNDMDCRIAGKTACNKEARICVRCTEDSHCAIEPVNRKCDKENNVCVKPPQCTNDEECASLSAEIDMYNKKITIFPYKEKVSLQCTYKGVNRCTCDSIDGICKIYPASDFCLGNDNCFQGVCYPGTQKCVNCYDDPLYGADESNCFGTWTHCYNFDCVGCSKDEDCAGNTNGNKCKISYYLMYKGECVQCLGDSDCPADKKRCSKNVCKQCLSNLDCNSDFPICSLATSECLGCSSDNDCIQNYPQKPVCVNNKCAASREVIIRN